MLARIRLLLLLIQHRLRVLERRRRPHRELLRELCSKRRGRVLF